MSDSDWKPDFTKENPYEGMPPGYAEEVQRNYVPTEDHPEDPVTVAMNEGYIETAPREYDPETQTEKKSYISSEAANKALEREKAKGIIYQDEKGKTTVYVPNKDQTLTDVADYIREKHGEPKTAVRVAARDYSDKEGKEEKKTKEKDKEKKPEGQQLKVGDIKFQQAPSGKVETGASGRMTSKVARTPAELEQIKKDAARYPDLAMSMTPVLGTTLLIAGKAPARAIALSALTDVLVVTPIPLGKAFGAVRNVIIPGSKEAAAIKAAVNAERTASRETLKAITNKETVKAFDEMSKASEAYAKNLTEIKVTEKAIKLNPASSATEKEALKRHTSYLASLQEKTTELKQKALLKSFNFSEKLGKSGAAGDLPLAETAKEASSAHVQGIKYTVDKAFSETPQNVKAMSRKMAQYKAQLNSASPETAAELQRKLPELKAQARLVYTAEAGRLHTEYIRAESKVKALKFERMAHPENRTALEADLKEAAKRAASLKREAEQATKRLEIEWAEPIPRQSGGGGIGTKAPPETSIGGGGRAVKETTKALPPLGMGAKIIYQSKDGDIEWTVPMKTFETPGKETIHVEPQPYWAGSVEAPEKEPAVKPVTEPIQPETKPAKRPDFEPGPGKITWTPSVVRHPKLQPGTIIQSGTQERELTASETKVLSDIQDKIADDIKSGMSPKQISETISKAYPGAKVQFTAGTQQKTEQKQDINTRLNMVNRTSPGTAPKPATRTQTQQKVEPKPKIQTKTPPTSPIVPMKMSAMSDTEKRNLIKRSKGAIAWRQGQLNGQDRWDVIVSPYSDKENYMIVLGKTPLGATVIKGPGSARKTAQVLYGMRLKEKTEVDQPGIFTTTLQPVTGHKGVSISFKRDAITSKGMRLTNSKVFPLSRR